MTRITFTLMLLALLIMSIKTLDLKCAKAKEAPKEKPVSKLKGKVNAERKCTGKVSCNDHNTCPEGYACLLPGFGKGKIKSNKKCFKCNCTEPSQCYFQDEIMLCNCSGSGFNGTFCETNIDDCETATCMNNGTCEDKVHDYSCNCLTGYTGKDCEINIDDCENTTCMNNGTCNDKVNDYICQCKPGYTGKNCEIDINECENVTCSNKGNCSDGVDSYTCQCSQGYSGTNCETSIDLCSPSPCVTHAECTNLDDGYICTCGPQGPINTIIDLNASSTRQKVCSPGYPSNYPKNIVIQWNIVAEDKQNIEVKFTDFVTEGCCDKVFVRDGPANETQFCIGVLSGSIYQERQLYYDSDYTYIDMEAYTPELVAQLANSFISSANKLSVLFNSDIFVTYRGFCFTYLSMG